jgi:hypothetical protein
MEDGREERDIGREESGRVAKYKYEQMLSEPFSYSFVFGKEEVRAFYVCNAQS